MDYEPNLTVYEIISVEEVDENLTMYTVREVDLSEGRDGHPRAADQGNQ